MDKYDQITTADEKGYALFRRVSDGKTARVPVRWFKKDGDVMVPRSRVKEIRLDGLNPCVLPPAAPAGREQRVVGGP